MTGRFVFRDQSGTIDLRAGVQVQVLLALGAGLAGGAVDVHAHVTFFHQPGLAGVQARPDSYCGLSRPRVVNQGGLDLDHGGHGLGSFRESGEKGVALGVHFTAVPLLQGFLDIWWWVARRTAYWSRNWSNNLVEPPMSVKGKVTVPPGRIGEEGLGLSVTLYFLSRRGIELAL